VTAFEEKQFMINKWFFYASLTLIIAFLSSGFKPSTIDASDLFLINENDGTHYLFPSEQTNDYYNLNVPYTGKFFIGYKRLTSDLGVSASSNGKIFLFFGFYEMVYSAHITLCFFGKRKSFADCRSIFIQSANFSSIHY